MADPTITTQPTNQSVGDGDPYTFTVVAEAGSDPVDDNWESVTLLLGQDQANASTTFTDESTAAVTVTATGNTQYSTADPKFGTSAIEFDGTGDYLSVPLADTVGTTWSQDLTFDFWVNVDTLASTQFPMGSRVNDATDNSGCRIALNPDGSVGFVGYYGDVAQVAVVASTAAGAISVNTWAFVRVIRSGGDWTVAVDGVAGTPVTENANVNHVNGGTALQFGADFLPEALTSPSFFNGQMEQIRITNGVAREITELPTAAFPTQGPVDDDWESVTNMYLFDTDFTDTKGNDDLVAIGTAPTISADRFLDGRLNGLRGTSSRGLESSGTAADWKFLSDGTEHTIDFYFEHSSDQIQAVPWVMATTSFSTQVGMGIAYTKATGTLQWIMYYGSSGQFALNLSATGLSSDTKYFVRCGVDAAGAAYIAVDGVVQDSSVAWLNTPSTSNPTVPLKVMTRGDEDASSYLRGYLGQIRFTNGVKREATELPTEPFPTQGPATLTYQWEEETSPAVWEAVVGETANVFTDTAVLADNGRVFRCAVTQDALWTPAEVATAAWFDAGDASTITEAAGLVSQWDDKSGNTRDLKRTNDTFKPETGVTSINGVNTLSFVSDGMILDADFTSQRAVFFVTSNLTGSSASGVVSPIVADGATGSDHTFVYNNNLPISISLDGSTSNTGNANFNGDSLVSGTNIDLGVTPAQDLLPQQWYTDYDANNTFRTVGYLNSGGDNWLNGEIGEVIVLDYVPSEAVRQTFEGYLAWKWGLEANLPVGHPYKLAAPLVGGA